MKSKFGPYYWLLQIIDSVVVAHILNATLVVPKLDQKSYWKDKRFDTSCIRNSIISILVSLTLCIK